MKTRDWITVSEYAKREGLKKVTVDLRIWRGTFRDPYDQTESGLILIYAPQTREAQKQATLPETSCNRAGTK